MKQKTAPTQQNNKKMSCNRIKQEYKPTILALKIDKRKLRAYYATDKICEDADGYIEHDCIKEVKLTSKEKVWLKVLLSETNWALIRVLSPNCTVKRIVEKHTYEVRYEINGSYEKWSCHRLGPQGQGKEFNHIWQQIESVVKTAIDRI